MTMIGNLSRRVKMAQAKRHTHACAPGGPINTLMVNDS